MLRVLRALRQCCDDHKLQNMPRPMQTLLPDDATNVSLTLILTEYSLQQQQSIHHRYPCNVLARVGEDMFEVEVVGKFGPIHRLTGGPVSPLHKQAIDTDTRHRVPRGKLRLHNDDVTAAEQETKRVDAGQLQQQQQQQQVVWVGGWVRWFG